MLIKILNKNTLKVVLNKNEAKKYLGTTNNKNKITISENLKYIYKIASNAAKISPLSYACEIYIISRQNKGCIIFFKQIKQQHIKKKSKITYCYKTTSAEDLLNIAEKLYKVDNQKASLYLFNKEYYLVLEKKPNIPNENDILLKIPYLNAYLEEYATLISSNAIDEIGVNF